MEEEKPVVSGKFQFGDRDKSKMSASFVTLGPSKNRATEQSDGF